VGGSHNDLWLAAALGGAAGLGAARRPGAAGAARVLAPAPAPAAKVTTLAVVAFPALAAGRGRRLRAALQTAAAGVVPPPCSCSPSTDIFPPSTARPAWSPA